MARQGKDPRFRPVLRWTSGFLIAWLGLAGPAHAVIPGIAPGLAAVLPQVLFFLLALLALLFSPRAWARLVIGAWRHPGWTAGSAAVAGLLALGLVRLPELFPRPAPGAEIPDEVDGFTVGDPRAARSRSSGPGPAATADLEVSRILPEGPGGRWDAGELSSFGSDVLVLSRDRKRVALLDPRASRILWEHALAEPAARSPVGFSRRRPEGGEDRGVAVLAGDLLVLDGRDGSIRKCATGAGVEALAVVDGRLLLAGECTIGAFSLAADRLLEGLWSAPRPARRAVDLAGDDQGRYFLLDAGALFTGDLAGGPLRELGRFEGPIRLGVRAGLACVLDRRPSGPARIVALDPALRGPREPFAAGGHEVWAREVDLPIEDEFSLGPSGVFLTHERSFEVLDFGTGSTLLRSSLDGSASCPAAAGRSFIFAGLRDGRTVRRSFALDRADRLKASWAAPEETDGKEVRSLLSVGDRLVLSTGGEIVVLAGASGEEFTPWGQWRGGPGRAATSDGAQVPLSARILWRRPASGGGEVRLLPLPEGWIAARALGAGTALDWIDDRGAALASATIDGACIGLVRLGSRFFAALKGAGGDRVASFSAGRSTGASPRLELLGTHLSGPLGEREPLCLDRETLLAARPGSVVAASALDGKRLWESPPIEGVEAPLAARGRVLVGGSAPGGAGLLFLALGLETGEVEWRHARKGERCLALALQGEMLFALLDLGKDEGRMISLSAADGSPRWDRSIGRPCPGPLVISEGRVLVHDDRGSLVILTAAGEEAGRIEPWGDARFGPAPPVTGSGVLLAARGRALRLIDSSTFETAWEVELPSPAGPFALERGRILIAAAEELICVGAEE